MVRGVITNNTGNSISKYDSIRVLAFQSLNAGAISHGGLRTTTYRHGIEDGSCGVGRSERVSNAISEYLANTFKKVSFRNRFGGGP